MLVLFWGVVGCGSPASSSAPVPSPEAANQAQPACNADESGRVPLSGSQAIYRDYGPAWARDGDDERTVARRPWSAWWFPIRDQALFRSTSGLSPLEKYDAYVSRTRNLTSMAAEYEEAKLFSPAAEGWEGLCHAWALASLLEPEPLHPVERGGIIFSVFDQKALLLKGYEEYALDYYGERYLDAASSDWESIRPHLFHRFVEAELLEKGQPFVMNKVPGVEVWNVPVWKASREMRRDATEPRLIHVRLALVATAADELPEAPGLSRDEVNIYTYDLRTRPAGCGREMVVEGEWTGVSKDMHPSILIPMPSGAVKRRSSNPNVSNEVLSEILAR